MAARESWHLDKRVPVALIATLLMYGGLALWWASGIEQRVAMMEREQVKTAAALQSVPGRLARLEAILERIEGQLRQRPGGGR